MTDHTPRNLRERICRKGFLKRIPALVKLAGEWQDRSEGEWRVCECAL